MSRRVFAWWFSVVAMLAAVSFCGVVQAGGSTTRGIADQIGVRLEGVDELEVGATTVATVISPKRLAKHGFVNVALNDKVTIKRVADKRFSVRHGKGDKAKLLHFAVGDNGAIAPAPAD